MIPSLFAGLIVLFGVIMLINWAATANPRSVARLLKGLGIVIGIGAVVMLAVTGNLAALGGLAFALLPFILNLRNLASRLKTMAGPSPGQKSGLDTAWLHVELDHDTGRMDGLVRQGPFAGRSLADLSLDELVALRRDCSVHDQQSVPIVEAFLDRSHGTEWRVGAEEGPGPGSDGHDRGAGGSGWGAGWGSGGARAGGSRGSRQGEPMTRAEAYRVLGLQPGADEEAIKRAHRQLMKKFHPDQGGSDYFAAKINEAKDILLRS